MTDPKTQEAPGQPPSAPTTAQTADRLSEVLADLAGVMAGVRPDQDHAPTPCAEFDVSQLRTHILGWLTNFADGMADPNGQTPRPDCGGYAPPDDPAAEVRQAADRMDSALRQGAAERPLRIGESAMPGGLALGMILWEYLVHGWDLSRATGQNWQPPEAAVEQTLVFAPGMLTPDFQGPGKAFADRVPVAEDAPALDRLLGLSGRDPGWASK